MALPTPKGLLILHPLFKSARGGRELAVPRVMVPVRLHLKDCRVRELGFIKTFRETRFDSDLICRVAFGYFDCEPALVRNGEDRVDVPLGLILRNRLV